MASPRVTIAKPARANGVLSVPASATQRKTNTIADAAHSRATPARLKILVRRLPPGLTQVEFEEALGEEWKAGSRKVDWGMYKPGKVSKDPAKPSRPSRAYLHVASPEQVNIFSENVRSASFVDAKGTSKDMCLLGPPSVEFAPYGRIPNSRPRKDARQGTIDQDPEFIDFLESLTNPIVKSTPVDQENEGAKGKEKVTSTPLIQYLKEKKANKGKDTAASSKSAKHGRHESKDGKATTTAAETKTAAPAASAPKKRSAQAVKVEQAAREAVKVLNKQAAGAKGATSPAVPTSGPRPTSPAVSPGTTATAALADKRRERGSASAAAKILQRDLGLAGHTGGRGSRRGMSNATAKGATANAQATSKQDPATSPATKASGTTDTPTGTAAVSPAIASHPTKPQAGTHDAPTGPAASRASSKTNTANPKTHATPSKATPAPSTATQAFLKHANPSQGITEPLLEEAFAGFGKITNLEIDKKKGFAYIDFAEVESLQKAIKASPVKVAQGQVVVLERKTGPSLQARNTRGGSPTISNRGGVPVGGRGMRGRSGAGRGASNTPNAGGHKATAAPASTPTPAATIASEGPGS